MIENALSKLFRYESIDGHGRCPTYLHRWTLFQPRWWRWLWRGFGVYLHKFVGDDWSRDLHDHPKRFISIGLKGAYREHSWNPTTGESQTRVFVAPWVRTFPADHTHRLELLEDRRPCWTLVFVLRTVREWGFWAPSGWRIWRDYVKAGDAEADAAAHCPKD